MQNLSRFIECFKNHVINRLDQSKIKITDLVLEELLSFALEDSGNDHLYESGSHVAGRDISGEDNASVKSGKQNKNILSISSFRLSRFNNDITKMINFIDNDGKNFDYYYVLARNENKNKIKYIFYILPSNIFIASNMNWIETKSGWETTDKTNIKLKIATNMSSQLWIYLNVDSIKQYIGFEIEKNICDLGKNRYVSK